MTTLSTMRTRIGNKLSDGSLQRPDSDEITTAINEAVDFYENRYFWFQQGFSALTTASDSFIIADSDLPSDFKFQQHPNSLVLIKNNYHYPLVHVTPIEFDRMTNDVSAGFPRYYTYRRSQIELYPTPDQAYTVNLYYYKNYSDLSGDTETNDFLTHASRLIENKSMYDLLVDYKPEDDRISTYERRVEREFNEIENETYNRTSTGRLTTENIAEYDFNYTDYYYRRNY